MTPGKIILLTGAASADKRRIAQALQAVLAEPYLYVGLEQLVGLSPDPALTPSILPNRQVISGMHQAIAALSRASSHVIVDHSLIEADWTYECAQVLGKLPLWLVAVCSSTTMGKTGEQVRNDRVPGVYDLTVDPAQQTALECAMQIKQRVQAGSPMAIHWLKTWNAPAKHRGWLRNCPSSADLATKTGLSPAA